MSQALEILADVSRPALVYVGTRLEVLWAMFVGGSDRLSAMQLAGSLLLAVIVLGRRSGDWRARALLAAAVPKSVYWTRSSLLDLQIHLTNAILRPTHWLMFGLSVGWLSGRVAALLDAAVGPPATRLPTGGITVLLVGAGMLVAADFSTYVMHRLAHQLRPLWAFHRVHHSAPVLTPLTVNRKHPVGEALGNLVVIAILGPLNGLLAWAAAPGLSADAAEVVATAYAAFAWFAGNLRHSHVPFSFGPLDRILVSPAMHQLHHSGAPEHWGCNFGEIFSVWDWAFGTLARPTTTVEPIMFGLAEGSEPHTTWRSAMLEPFVFLLRGRGQRAEAVTEPAAAGAAA